MRTFPAVADGSLYATTDAVVRYRRRSVLDSLVGSAPGTAWRRDLSVIPRPPAATGELVVYGGRSDRGAPAVRLADGSVAWTRRIDQRVTDVAATRTAVVIATTTATGDDSSAPGTVRSLDPDDGSENWRMRFRHAPTSLAVVDGAIFAVTETGEAIAIK